MGIILADFFNVKKLFGKSADCAKINELLTAKSSKNAGTKNDTLATEAKAFNQSLERGISMQNRNLTLVHEDRYRNGISLRVEREVGRFQRVSVVLNVPLEEYTGIASQEEVNILLRVLSDKYGTVTLDELTSFDKR